MDRREANAIKRHHWNVRKEAHWGGGRPEPPTGDQTQSPQSFLQRRLDTLTCSDIIWVGTQIWTDQGGAIGSRCEDVRKKAYSKGGRFEPPASNQPTALECLAKEVRLLDLLKHRLDAPFLCATPRVCCQPIVGPFRRSSTLRQPQRIVKGQKKSIGLGRDAYEYQRIPLAIDIDSRKLVRSWRIHRLQMEVPSNEEQNGRAQTAIPTSSTSRT